MPPGANNNQDERNSAVIFCRIFVITSLCSPILLMQGACQPKRALSLSISAWTHQGYCRDCGNHDSFDISIAARSLRFSRMHATHVDRQERVRLPADCGSHANVRAFQVTCFCLSQGFQLLLLCALAADTSYFSRVIRSARPTGFHSRGTMAIITIHRSNFARSIANSMSAAKRIERNAIRFIMQVQI